jgi:hypothetical protein
LYNVFALLKIGYLWTSGLAQDIESLLCKYEALSSRPNPTKKKKGKIDYFMQMVYCNVIYMYLTSSKTEYFSIYEFDIKISAFVNYFFKLIYGGCCNFFPDLF